jgi:hypothetical protein
MPSVRDATRHLSTGDSRTCGERSRIVSRFGQIGSVGNLLGLLVICLASLPAPRIAGIQDRMKPQTIIITLLVFTLFGIPDAVRNDVAHEFLDGLGIHFGPYAHTAGEGLRYAARELTGANGRQAKAEHDKCETDHADAIASATTEYKKLTKDYEACRDEFPGQVGVYCREQWKAWHATALRIDALNANDPCMAPT